MAATAPTLPNVELLFGPMLVGVFFNMILYGVLIGQVLTYHQMYRHDASWMRYFVAFLFFIETCNTGFDMAFMYQPLIAEYGQKPVFFPTFFVTEPLIIASASLDLHICETDNRQVMVSTPIQLFFAWRIKSLTKSYWVPAVIAVLALGSFAGGIWTAVVLEIIKTFAKKPKMHNSALLWFLSSCVADILITISLVISLATRKTGFSGTDSVINKIIRMTIQTGMVTSLFSILDVICFMVLPHAAVNFIWDLALSKLYTNCLMSTLNARASLSDVSSGGVSGKNRNPSHMVNPTSPTVRRPGESFLDHSRHMDSSAVYELETPKTAYDVESGYKLPARDDYGIQVTTVIEHTKDPVPHPYTQ
ncbi:hypothetical protein DFH07DRAFT_950842 [Mycena maculata]|uniref:DUF6534 domain-containing protein n=1 Tax=Mycena maculata TaxID=230809 RepID=A0AAD7K5M1_9AGAR|nr:hypothetical protein DFH07DRAFT_950842 [Mycena maculata]